MNSLFVAVLQFLALPANFTINHSESVGTSFGGMFIDNQSPDSEDFHIYVATRIYFQDVGPVEYDYSFVDRDIFFTKAFVEHLWINGSFDNDTWKASFNGFVTLHGDPDCANIQIEAKVNVGLVVCFGGDNLELRRVQYQELVGNQLRPVTFDLTGVIF